MSYADHIKDVIMKVRRAALNGKGVELTHSECLALFYGGGNVSFIEAVIDEEEEDDRKETMDLQRMSRDGGGF